MKFLEKDLEQIIYETPNHILNDRNLAINGYKRRQVQLGNYGRADLITLERNRGRIAFTIYEFKQGEINQAALMQGVRYMAALNHYLTFRDWMIKFDIDIYLVLIGNSVSMDAMTFVEDVIFNVDVYTFDYDFDGIMFKPVTGYHLKDHGFKHTSKTLIKNLPF